jgi:hypothetical protein
VAFILEVVGIWAGATALQRRSAALDTLLGAVDDVIRWRRAGQAGPTDPLEVEDANSLANRLFEARERDKANAGWKRARDYGAIVCLIGAALCALIASLVWYSQP